MGLLWLVPVVIAIVTVLYLALNMVWRRRARRPVDARRRRDSQSDDTPREGLNSRYADGEISEDEYKRTRTDLG